MITVVGYLVFAAAFAASAWVLAFTLVPAMPRIIGLLRDGVDPTLVVCPALIVRENRVRSRVRTALAQPTRATLRAAA